MLLRKLDAGQLNAVYARLLADGKRTVAYGGGTGLSPRTVRYVHTIIHRMLRDAVRWGRVPRNVADAADPPRAAASSRPPMRRWTAEQVRAFLSTKTARSRRTVALDPGAVSALREHRQRMVDERLLMGAGFTDHGLVFCRPDGGPLHPERFSRTFTLEATRAGLPRIRLHDLRHSWATMALSAGIHPKIVQERLGHSGIAITLDTYSHVTDGLHGDAANLVASLIARPVSKRRANAGGGDDE